MDRRGNTGRGDRRESYSTESAAVGASVAILDEDGNPILDEAGSFLEQE